MPRRRLETKRPGRLSPRKLCQAREQSRDRRSPLLWTRRINTKLRTSLKYGALSQTDTYPITVTVQIEGAFTQVFWNGTSPFCWTLNGITQCNYPVQNNSTAATTPPDNDFTGASVGPEANYVGIATYISWITVAPCIRFATSGPWTCTHAFAQKNSMNVTMPPYACKHNP